MNRQVVIVAFTILLCVSATAQKGKWAAPEDATAKWMIEMERRWAAGPCDHNRVADTILADDFQGTGTDGKRYTKADDLADTDNKSRSANDCKLIDAKVRFFGDHLAIIYGGESRVVSGVTRTQVWTDTWLKRGGRWQVIAAQDGRIENPGEGQNAFTDPPLQFLLATASDEFRTHRPPSPVRFRDVRFGHMIDPAGAKHYLLCGEYLPAPDQDKAGWTPFATINTSGYEQWLGGQAAGYCRRPTVVWHNEGDLSSALQSRFDSRQ